MRPSIRRALRTGMVVVALAASAPNAFAAPQPPPGATATVGSDGALLHGPARHLGGHRGGMLEAAARFLGLTPSALRTQLQSGKSLAQIAGAQGKSVQGLKQALLAARKARLAQAVASGRLSQAEAQTIFSRIEQHIDQVINRTPQRGATGSNGR